MSKKASKSRWEKAQAYEKQFWQKQAYKLVKQGDNYFKWYEERAQQIFRRAQPFLKGFSSIRALEIGPGPIGLINYLKLDHRFALDPLEDYNRSQPEVIRIRDKRVKYCQGTGEDISSLNTVFSFIIIDNVLDHVMDPQRVLHEIYRNLEPQGIMFISLNIYTRFGVLIRNLMELFEIDKGHPFSYSKHSISSLLRKIGFEILWRDMDSYHAQKRRYRHSKKPKEMLKSYLDLTDFRFSALCKKT